MTLHTITPRLGSRPVNPLLGVISTAKAISNRAARVSQTPRHRLGIVASGTTAIASISICQAGSANDATCAIVSAG
jgi:hypothetical protein